ncbi:MAG: hypothetical protein WAW63_00790 [Candidatus Saccharimonadales bacterium]
MAYKSKKLKQKQLTKEEQEQLDHELKELAELLYDIYQDKKRKEKNNDVPSNI